MNCTSGCPTQDHDSYAACLRAKAPAIQGCETRGGTNRNKQQRWDGELDRARRLMSQGVLPDNTFGKALDKAERISDVTGVAYRGDA